MRYFPKLFFILYSSHIKYSSHHVSYAKTSLVLASMSNKKVPPFKKRILLLLQHIELIPCGDVCGLNLSISVIDEASHILISSPDEANRRFSCMVAPTKSLQKRILNTIKNNQKKKKKAEASSIK